MKYFRIVIFSLVFWAVSVPAELAARPMGNVFGIQMSRDTDLLVLLDGSRLTGTLLNKTFALRTAYAPLKFESGMLAGIDLESGAQNGEVILTVNHNRFSGFLEDSFFFIQSPTGEQTKIRREKVGKVVFRDRGEALAGMQRGRCIRLKNGDWCSGEFTVESLTLATPGGQESFNKKNIKSLAFTTNTPPLANVTLRTGKTAQGKLELEDLPIKLDVGPAILIYRDNIQSIGDELFPVASNSTNIATSHEANSPAPSTMIASQAGSTNIEGMVWIPAGEFTMGSPIDEAGRDMDEGPQTRMVIPHGFWMGKCEVTQGEFQAVMGTNPSNTRGDTNCPVEKVSWYDAMQYCAKRTQQEKLSAKVPENYAYRLPTEAEWEYACRAGTATRFYYGDDKGEFRLGEYAWFIRNGDSMTHPVGTLKPNAWGLHDMHGNVWEWCFDRWQSILPGGSVTNLPVATEGSLRVARGGSWLYESKACRSANRDDYSPSNRCSDVGFRVVLAPL
jgi:formylglycine-generating enzyme required for sulfatase activity